eukprot:12659934-Ditylum_brightwellii.AAC.1
MAHENQVYPLPVSFPKVLYQRGDKQQTSLTQDLADKDDVWNLDDMQASKRRKILENRKKNSIWSTAKKMTDDERQVAIAMRQVAIAMRQVALDIS